MSAGGVRFFGSQGVAPCIPQYGGCSAPNLNDGPRFSKGVVCDPLAVPVSSLFKRSQRTPGQTAIESLKGPSKNTKSQFQLQSDWVLPLI